MNERKNTKKITFKAIPIDITVIPELTTLYVDGKTLHEYSGNPTRCSVIFRTPGGEFVGPISITEEMAYLFGSMMASDNKDKTVTITAEIP